MSNDTVITREASRLEVTTEQHDTQHWHCHTRLERLTIPERMTRGVVLDDIRELHDLSKRLGFTQIHDGTYLRNIGEIQAGLLLGAGVEPELVDIDGNLLVYGGASCQWQTLIGNGTATAGQALTYFSNAQAAIGVGDSTTAAAATQTNLVAATNKLRVAMDATYPSHTDGTTSGSASCVFKGTFSTAQANYAWQEWAVFNSTTDGTGRMLQRKVESLGTKTSSSTWALTITLSLA